LKAVQQPQTFCSNSGKFREDLKRNFLNQLVFPSNDSRRITDVIEFEKSLRRGEEYPYFDFRSPANGGMIDPTKKEEYVVNAFRRVKKVSTRKHRDLYRFLAFIHLVNAVLNNIAVSIAAIVAVVGTQGLLYLLLIILLSLVFVQKWFSKEFLSDENEITPKLASQETELYFVDFKKKLWMRIWSFLISLSVLVFSIVLTAVTFSSGHVVALELNNTVVDSLPPGLPLSTQYLSASVVLFIVALASFLNCVYLCIIFGVVFGSSVDIYKCAQRFIMLHLELSALKQKTTLEAQDILLYISPYVRSNTRGNCREFWGHCCGKIWGRCSKY
jgi:hypothetical protein